MIKFLVYVALVLAAVAVAQIVRVFELASVLKGGKPNDITENDNKMNGRFMMLFMILFYGFCFWQVYEYGDKILPESASDIGLETDWLLWFNMLIISVVFLVTNGLLFYFAYKYYGRDNNRATFYPHNNKLEMIWTVVPAIVLLAIIFLGLKLWNEIVMTPPKSDALVIELYAKQFDWTARYGGKDNTLGTVNYKLITGTNVVGLDSADQKGWDDLIVRNEFHIPKGRQVSFQIRSRDVIHSAYMPHFRQQMNAVPGMVTEMHFVPILTTKEMREKTHNNKFDFILLCNKICGASHYNMQMTIIVDEPADYETWVAKQQAFFAKPVIGMAN